MSANKNFSGEDRAALVNLLERFGLTVQSFDALRSDSYEQSLARHSLEHLELLYVELLKPGQAQEEAQRRCPPWPPGSARAGRQPSTGALSQIAERIRTESTLNSLGRVSTFVEKLRSRADSLPAGKQNEVLDTIVTLVGEEMIQARLGGAPMIALLDPLDRLLTSQGMKTKAEFEREKIELRKQAEARSQEKLRFEREKWVAESCRKILAAATDQRAKDIAEMSVTNEEKIRMLRAEYFKDVDALEASGEVKLPA
ncbi:MAG TPA: hypothetical protein PKA41_14530 [Verrucomicrobiota bacterium]|nr:hypothetical protein [Verrucomicrobiota bacterium]